MEQRRSDILSAAARVQDGAGVVILTDMFGGTPSNLAISVMDGGRVEVICGVNLPMLIKLATMRESADLDHAVVRRAMLAANTSRSQARSWRGNDPGPIRRRLPAASAH